MSARSLVCARMTACVIGKKLLYRVAQNSVSGPFTLASVHSHTREPELQRESLEHKCHYYKCPTQVSKSLMQQTLICMPHKQEAFKITMATPPLRRVREMSHKLCRFKQAADVLTFSCSSVRTQVTVYLMYDHGNK